MAVASTLALAVEHRRTVCWAIAGFLIAACVGNMIRVWYRLKDFKGPFSVAFSKLWLLRSHVRQTVYLDVAAVCEKYGER